MRCLFVAGIFLCMHPANERWCFNVSSLIGWVHTQNDPWLVCCRRLTLIYLAVLATENQNPVISLMSQGSSLSCLSDMFKRINTVPLFTKLQYVLPLVVMMAWSCKIGVKNNCIEMPVKFQSDITTLKFTSLGFEISLSFVVRCLITLLIETSGLYSLTKMQFGLMTISSL